MNSCILFFLNYIEGLFVIKTQGRFVVLMAFLMSLVALCIDAMMPALGIMRVSLGVLKGNDIQLVISVVFFGMAFGLMLYGPLSDAWGRKKALVMGISIFVLGSFISILTESFTVMLVGRFLQGFGGASCRVVTTAMIRDKYEGPEMGRIMSLITVIFIIVPALAPSIGQLILFIAPWQAIFVLFIVLGTLAIYLIHFKQEETLAAENRIPMSLKTFKSGVKETFQNRQTLGYTIAAGLVFGAFVGYLSLAQQILQVHFDLGKKFSIYFGFLAICIGLSSFINSKIVIRFGMEKLSRFSLLSLALIAGAYLVAARLVPSVVNLTGFAVFLASSFLFIGILFGNLNTLAIQPLGHIAGTANSVISSVQTLLSVGIGAALGQLYSGSVLILAWSFFSLSILSLLTIIFTGKKLS